LKGPSDGTRRIRTSAFAALAALTFVAAACGSDDDDSAEPAAPAATEPMTTQPMATTPSGPACGAVPTEGEGSFSGMADDPAATAASNNPELSTLVSAVGAAGLVDTLNGPGPFTIFAPVNSAFAKIPAADLDAVLADTALLTSILTYHVVPEQLSSVELAEAGTVTTVNGGALEIALDGDALRVNGGEATVVCQDVPTANATVYLIDSVLMPAAGDAMAPDAGGAAMAPSGPACGAVPAEGEGSFVGMADDPAATAASNNPELSTLVSAVSAAGLVDTLNGEGPFTIFAPANSAFAKVPAADLDALLADPMGALTDILTIHVVAGASLSSADLVEAGTVAGLNGELVVAADGDAVTVDAGGGPATVVCADVPLANGTVHIIDTVLLPAS
jgi:uncharacterized surface protein with fasciclin (FAS1) repeats